ncbi:hypothetical protein LTR92_011048 [Exophiala xenobiotica]|nr:hypothetical protein LTR92_011048 [Exophiala xenobiotica]
MSRPLDALGPWRPIMSNGELQDEGRAPAGHPSRSSRSTATHSRTSHACSRCRVMRTKCSGGDRCLKCVKDDATCVYGDRKRERNKKDLAETLDRNEELKDENLVLLTALRSLAGSDDFDSARHGDIVDLLSTYSAEQSESGQEAGSQFPTVASSNKRRRATLSPMQHGESSNENDAKNAASRVGSLGRQGELAHVVDLDSGTGASGFIGKMSETSWIQHAFEILDYQRPPAGEVPELATGELDHLSTAKHFSFFMDDLDVLAVDEDLVDPDEWPPAQTAALLSEAYFHAMQDTFPFVDREPFLRRVFSYPRERSVPSWSQRGWLAVANIVWAIGDKWLQMTRLDHQEAQDTHLVYYARARALGLDHRVMFDHPDVDRVQGIGLLAFYLLINGSIARAWNTLGHATRHATALGLHLTVSDPAVNDKAKEGRARTWYSLYSLEILIAEITGRPKSIFLSDSTTTIEALERPPTKEREVSQHTDNYASTVESRRMWLDFLRARHEIAQAVTGPMVQWMRSQSPGVGVSPLYLPHRLRACRLSDRIATQLYSGTSTDSWSQVQRKISELQTDLTHWRETLPDELKVQNDATADTDPRVGVELAMYYHSLQMILHRPCLGEVNIENQSRQSKEFNRSSARACVHAAMSLLAIMPDNLTAHEAYQLLPWWTLLHCVAQATAVLMLEMALSCQHLQDEIDEVMKSMRKAMSYIWCMTSESLSAYRAWRIFRQLLSAILHKHEHYGTVDIPEEAPRPKGWTETEETTIRRSFFHFRNGG